MAVTHREYTFWVTPAEPLKSQLSASIHKLYREFDAVDFPPHMTIYAGPSNDEEVHGLAKLLIKKFSTITLQTESLAQSDLLTKTFYVQFEESAKLQRMTEMIRAGSAQPSDYTLNPHLSLLYQFIDEAQRKALCSRKDVASLGTYHFDTLAIYELDMPVTDLQPLRTWRSVGSYPLTKK